MDLQHFLSLLDKFGTLGCLAIITYAFARGWIVPKWAYESLKRDYERMQQIAMRTTELSERSAAVGERAVLLVQDRKP